MKKISVQKIDLELGFEWSNQVELGFGGHTIFDFSAKIVVLTTFPVSKKFRIVLPNSTTKNTYTTKKIVWVDQGPIL